MKAECCSNHIHIFMRMPPKYSVLKIMGRLKYKYDNKHF
ncbi:MAG: transposase [Candidatus Adiutrix intracellularis]|nr:transposase [Candidatus Adiutrix intracellularis]